MINPWLKISASDYVNHMSSLEVMQYQMINECFKTALDKYRPQKILVPGCTIGNGFEHINWTQVEKVTALDINENYLQILRQNYGYHKNLEVVVKDIVQFNSNKKYDLIFAALLFEYVDLRSTLKKIKEFMSENSVLYTIIQLQNKKVSMISKTKYKSLEQLSSIMKLVNVQEFYLAANVIGLKILSEKKITLKSGKSFQVFEINSI